METTELDPIEAQFKRIQFSKKIETQKKKVPYDVKNYLNVKLSGNEDTKKLTIRILNLTPDSKTPFAEVHQHYLPLAKKSYICAKQTENLPESVDKTCPFCDIRDQAKSEQKGANEVTWNKLKEIYKQNSSMVGYIVRVIDRDDEAFGIKFWKFSEPVYKMIYNIYQDNKADGINIFDYENGKDLTITIENLKGKTKVTNVSAKNSLTPLCKNQDTANKLITDDKLWSDVYGIKPYEYLEVVINGGTPYFDKVTSKWIDKKEVEQNEETDYEETYAMHGTNETSENESSDTESDDLPF